MSCNSSDKTLNGVKCVVTNCVHHNTNNECTARGIVVGGQDANKVSETGCETFSKKECC